MIKINKKADLNVTITVLMTLVLFISAIFIFAVKTQTRNEAITALRYVQEANSMVEKIKFYRASGGDPEDLQAADVSDGSYTKTITINGNTLEFIVKKGNSIYLDINVPIPA